MYLVVADDFVGDADVGDGVGVGDAEADVGAGVGDELGVLPELLLQPEMTSTEAAPSPVATKIARFDDAIFSPWVRVLAGSDSKE